MVELRTFEGGHVAIREDEGNDGRTLEGYAYRWGELSRGGTKETGVAQESFARGAFSDAIAERGDRPWPFMDTHYSKGGRTIGGIRFREDDTGLAYNGRLLDTDTAREYALAVTEAGSNEVSLEVALDPKAMRRKGGAIVHQRVQRIAALAGVPYAAYAGATVAIRDASGGHDVPELMEISERVDALDARITAGPIPLTEEQTTALARTVAEEVARGFAERSGAQVPAHALAGLHSLGEMMVAAWKGDAPRDFVGQAVELAERALDDVVSTSGVNAALLTGNLTVRNVAGIVSRGRPAITAFGGPRSVGETGLSITWPYFDGTLTDFVAAQSAQKAEITSSPLDIKLGTEALVTYAGGADVALQLIRQSDPAVLDIFGQIVLTAWGVVTDTAFVTELESGSVTQDLAEAITAVDFTELVSHVITASLAVQTATGNPAEFVLASTTAFSKAANLIAAASNQVVTNGTLDLAGLNVGIGNLRIIHVPSITAGKFIVSNRLAASWHEAGPFYVTALDVAKLGQNVAWWSMGAGARYIPAGIIELYDVTP